MNMYILFGYFKCLYCVIFVILTCVFFDKINVVYFTTKRVIKLYWQIIAQFLYYLRYLRYSKGLFVIKSMTILHLAYLLASQEA